MLLVLVLARRTLDRDVRQLLLLARRVEGAEGRQFLHLPLLMGHKLLIKHGSQVHIYLLCRRRCSRDRRRQRRGMRQGGHAKSGSAGRAHRLLQAHVHGTSDSGGGGDGCRSGLPCHVTCLFT